MQNAIMLSGFCGIEYQKKITDKWLKINPTISAGGVSKQQQKLGFKHTPTAE